MKDIMKILPRIHVTMFFFCGFVSFLCGLMCFGDPNMLSGVWLHLMLLWCASGSIMFIQASWLRQCMERVTALEERLASAPENAAGNEVTSGAAS